MNLDQIRARAEHEYSPIHDGTDPLSEACDDATRLVDALQDVLAFHVENSLDLGGCLGCHHEYPCPTRKLIEGTEP